MLLFSTHAILAAGLKTPELALTKTEAETLAKATADVAQYYPMAISPETIAKINLATCMAMTYGPRAYMIRARLEREAKDRNMKRANGTHSDAPASTPEAQAAAAFVPPGMPGSLGPTSDASTM